MNVKLSTRDIVAGIKRADELYYGGGSSTMPDAEYDELKEELRRREPAHSLLSSLGPAPRGTKVKHREPMLSLGKSYDIDKLAIGNCEDYVVEPKYDGVSLALQYGRGGRLERAATRGDGAEGEDVSRTASIVTGVLSRLKNVAVEIEIRGEVVIQRAVFAAKYADDFKNTRNVVAGSLSSKTPDVRLLRDMNFVAYGVVGVDFVDEESVLNWLIERGFEVASSLLAQRKNLRRVVESITAAGATLYDIDGAVIKVSSHKLQRSLGVTGHHPRWAVAYKLQGESGKTILRDIEWQVSRTGAISPVAVFDPVELSGVTVTKATLHHAGRVREAHAFVGDVVLVTRRGGVIPHVESFSAHTYVQGEKPKELVLPEHCPSCGSDAVLRGDFLFCTQPDTCSDAVVAGLKHYAHRVGMLGWGDGVITAAVEAGVLVSPSDFYKLLPPHLLALPRVGEKLADRLLGEVNKARTLDLGTFLSALGIADLGHTVSEQLEVEFGGSLDRVLDAAPTDLMRVPGIGETMARNISGGLLDMDGEIATLREYVTIAKLATEPKKSGALTGKSFVFTGALSDMDREVARALVREHGAETPNTVNKTVTHLVVGDEAKGVSSKRRKAEDLNAKGASIAVIDEATFVKILAEVES